MKKLFKNKSNVEDLIYCDYCKCNTQQVEETTGTRCQKCLNQNPFFNVSSNEFADYISDVCIENNLRSVKDINKHFAKLSKEALDYATKNG